MDEARHPLLATMLEAEAVWGKRLKELIAPVFKLEREFVIFVRLHLNSIDPRNSVQGQFSRQELLGGRRNILYDLDDADDVYWEEVLKALNEVEIYLRSRLIPD
ncbi:hypothetical protein SAMN05660385_02089 [Pseudomonas sp. URIL14HWK12:I5]|nr:hypothetical protein SAMN05660385_02089 [Pseudomonas sp. URIL14HWK12:I5]